MFILLSFISANAPNQRDFERDFLGICSSLLLDKLEGFLANNFG